MRKRSVVSPITTLTVFLLLLTSTFTIMTLIPPVHAQTGTMLGEIQLARAPASVAFDGVDTLYFTAYDPAYFDPTFAGRVWSIKTDGTGLTTVADLPGGTPPFPGEWPRNIVALAYDSSRDGLWLSVSPVNEIHFLDLSTLVFHYRFSPPAAAGGAFNAPNGLAHDPVTDTLFFSAAFGFTIYLTDSSGNPISEFDLETFFRGSNNGMAWDGEKLWLARHPGNPLGSDFIHTYDVNLDLPAGTPRHGGPYFYDAGAPNGLAFDNETFSPSCALWATPTDGTTTLRAYEVPCPLFEAPDITPPTVTTSGPWAPGYLEVSFQDLESGLAEIFLIGDPALRNAETTIPMFAEGTTNVVTVTVERINHDLESRVALRALDVRGNFRNIGTLIPAGMIGTLLGEASTPTGSPVTVEIDGVTVTFDEVTESGTTSVIVHDDGPPPPSGFMLGDPPTYFDVSTTATYSGQVMVCIDYSGITFDDEAALRLGHYENGVWVDRTISLDMENNIICALVDSLSFFTALESEVPGAPPVADPNGPYTGTAGVPMQFTGAGSSDPDGTIVSYDWDFGDGGTGTGVLPTHTYASDGLYTVTLTVTDDDGLTDTAATTAEIGEAPPLRTIESCDSTGTKKDTFDIPEDVYVIGSGYSALTSYDLYVVDDVDWTDGMAIPPRVSGTAASATSDGDGNIPATPVWTGPLVLGKYDIVVDVDGDGIYYEEFDALDDGDIQVTAGFFVIPEVALGTIMASAAMIVALVAYVTMTRWRKKQQYSKP